MDADLWLPIALGLPFLASILGPALERLRPRLSAVVAAAMGVAAFAILLGVWADSGPQTVSKEWVPAAGVAFTLRLDALGFLFGLLVSGIGALIFAYSYAYMKDEKGLARFFAYLAVFQGSMLGLVLAGDLVLLFVFWEGTTVSSFLLIGFQTEDARSNRSAMKALLITGGGGLALFVAILLVRGVTGTFDVGAVLASGDAIRGSDRYLPILFLFVVSIAAKSAQAPLHIWLPDAMVAPTPVSAYLHSAAMVKAGIYLAARFLPALVSDAWGTALVPLGLATMVLGGLLAIRTVDLKRILAYSTVSQLGLMAAAFGFAGEIGQQAGLFQLLNHALFKAALFLVAGAVTVATGFTDLTALGGLRRRMPITSAACGLATLSLAGIPPLGGFLGKEYFLDAALETQQAWIVIVAVLGSTLTVAYSLNFFRGIFLGGESDASVKESKALSTPPLVLASLSLVLGFAPSLASDLIGGSIVDPPATTFEAGLLKLSLAPALLSLTSVALGLLILWKYEATARAIDRVLGVLGRATFDGVYHGIVDSSHGVARKAAFFIQNGSLSRYSTFLILFSAGVLLITVPIPNLELPSPEDVTGLVFSMILLAMVALAALAAAVRETLHAVLSLSGMGFLLATVFMLLHAPDLAMTQILVEMVFLAIFLIILYKIPRKSGVPRRHHAPLDGVLGIATAIGVTYLVSESFATFRFPSIANFFLDPALFTRTGGRNIVNVIITDFRAFDTLGETAVVAIAALAVYALLRRWEDR